MIQYANDMTKQRVYDMWKTVFGDSDEYMELYFREKYRNENTLIYWDGDTAVSSLQLLSFGFSFLGEEIPVAYFSGLCTLPEARKKGFMGVLIERSFQELTIRGIPLAVLVPQEEWLLTFYGKFGFAQTFDAGIPLPGLKEIVEQSNTLQSAYQTFDSFFRHRDMTVQKSFDDFRVIVEEAVLFDFPAKKSLTGMARIIDAEKLLSIFVKKYPETRISVKISDPMIEKNNAVFVVANGKVSRKDKRVATHFDIKIDDLARLLLGYKITELPGRYGAVFPEKRPLIGFMME